ncbi:MinD/ParA family ATP-binding protein [Acrocarpospora catenulata]|uniref:MinD/ParA family ATP-binding protein n=1 Tax=Acrocarpospora catenulata TaxID=2836182 RepID=UPI0027DEDB51|nr:MinD/ParA family protein [Acrocarpospora catenulata]
MARHDREDPHSLEDQLAWLDAIKEMPDEVDIAVSAVTASSLASGTSTLGTPPPPPAEEAPSPYPKDPWLSVPAEPAPLFRTSVEADAPAAPADDDAPTNPPGGTPPFGAGRGAFGESPVDTDSYNVGAFAEEKRAAQASPAFEPYESYEESAEEPVRGWLEPARPVTEPDSGESERFTGPIPGFPGEHSTERFGSRDFGKRDFAGRDTGEFGSRGDFGQQDNTLGFGADLRKREEFGTGGETQDDPFAARDTPFGLGDNAFRSRDTREPRTLDSAGFPEPRDLRAQAQESREVRDLHDVRDSRDESSGPFGVIPGALGTSGADEARGERFGGSLRDDLAFERDRDRDRDHDRDRGRDRDLGEQEREPYQPRRRQTAPPVSAFNSPTRTTSSRSSGKPSADSLDPLSLLKGRRNAPENGWRRLIYKASAGLIKPGESSEVRRRRDLIARARTPVAAGHHRVAVLSLKGGVGKTTTTVGLGATLAQVRGDRVIAVDANPDRGTLSDKVELETSATIRDLLNERAQIRRYADIRSFTSQTQSRLEILGSDRDPSVSEAFSAADYQAVSQVLENFYSICITDCGTGLLHSAMSGVLGLADQLVLVSSPSVDGARAASATLDWLEAHNYADLVKAASVVLCSVRPRSKSTVDLNRLEAHFAARCRAVIRVPYDPHLEEGAEIDLDRMLDSTQEAFLKLAASVGDGFAGPQSLTERRYSEIPDQL